MASRESAFGTPTLHDLTVALAGAVSIDEVAAAIVERGAEVVGATSAHLSVIVRPGWRRDYASDTVRLAKARASPTPTDRPISIDTPLSRAIVTRQEQEFESREQFRATFAHLGRELDRVTSRSAITVPLCRAGGEVIGALTYGFADPGPLPQARRTSARQAAEQGALALDRAVLLHREREAARRALRLHAASTELAGVVHLADLAAVLRRAGRDPLGAIRCVAYALAPGGHLRLVDDGLREYPAMQRAGDASPVRDAMVLAGAVVIETPAQFAARYAGVTWPPDAALLALPLRVGARLVGVLHIGYEYERRFEREDRSLASGLAEQAALALDRALLREHAEMQTRLVESERDRLMAITSSLQDGLFTSDPEGLILDTNDRFCEIVGFPREIVVGARPPYPWWPGVDADTTLRVVRDLGRVALEDRTGHPEFDVVFQHPDGQRVVGLLSVAPLHGSDGTAIGAVATVKDVTARVSAERRFRVLQAITGGLAAARTIEDVARATVDEAVVALRARGGAFFIRRDRADAVEPAYTNWDTLDDHDAAWPGAPLACDVAVDRAMRTTDVVRSDDIDDAETAALLASCGAGRAVWIPVCIVKDDGDGEPGRNEAVACLALAWRRNRPLPPEDIALFAAIGQQCGQAVDRALASDAEHRARVAAERSGERTRRLQQATAALTIASEPLDVARAVTRHARALVAANGIALFGLDDETDELVLIDNGLVQASDVAAQVMRVPLDAPLSIAEAARTRQSIWIHNLDEWRERYAAGAATLGVGYSALVVLPMVAQARILGVLALVFRDPLDLDEDDRSVLSTLADLAAHALHRAARFAAERTVAQTLQQSLLPRSVEVTDRCKVAVRYEPAVDRLAVGGDWYDALVLEPGRLAVMVGDVVGRGLNAAASMGQLRSALGALAVRSDAPGVVLEMLDRFAERIDGGEAATAAFAIIDTACGSMRYACAGHPPPLLIEPGEPPRFLEQGRSWPLGIGHRDRSRPDAVVRLRPGSAVVFYTDGLVERRRTSLDERLAALADAAGAGPVDDPAVLCDRLFDTLLDDNPRDDVAALSLVYDPALAERPSWTFPATHESVRDARELVRRWLDRQGVADAVAFDITVACDEACANAVEHGSRSDADEVALELGFDKDAGVVLSVTDSGSWVPSTGSDDRGKGLVLMRALMSHVDISTTATGTQVSLRRRLDG
jgi:PAS domain S-box-containing protein